MVVCIRIRRNAVWKEPHLWNNFHSSHFKSPQFGPWGVSIRRSVRGRTITVSGAWVSRWQQPNLLGKKGIKLHARTPPFHAIKKNTWQHYSFHQRRNFILSSVSGLLSIRWPCPRSPTLGLLGDGLPFGLQYVYVSFENCLSWMKDINFIQIGGMCYWHDAIWLRSRCFQYVIVWFLIHSASSANPSICQS